MPSDSLKAIVFCVSMFQTWIMTILRYSCFIFALCLLPTTISANSNRQHLNHHDPSIDHWLDTVLGWEGQIGQMAQIDVGILLKDDKSGLDQDKLNRYIGELGIGSVLNNVAWNNNNDDNNDLEQSHFWKATDFRNAVIQIQATAQAYHRPPVLWGLDSVHGANYIYDTILSPQPLNLAATFNTTTALQAGRWASRDTRRAGIPWLFSPLLGLSWNSFWSRTYETFGEDPWLVGEMAYAMIQGIQQTDDVDDNIDSTPIVPSRAAACGKHWLGYSFPHNGHDRAPSWIPRRHLYQYFLKPWQKVLTKKATTLTKRPHFRYSPLWNRTQKRTVYPTSLIGSR
jgi:beta-glucosidase